MPGRENPLITGEIYHILNRGVASQPIFLNKRNYRRATETILYYQQKEPGLSYSHFLELPPQKRNEILTTTKKQAKLLVEIIAFCLMPNHFHLLLKQLSGNGISIFLGTFTNSYTRYFNTSQERVGPLFQGRFKAIRIEDDEQLLHVSRYIHLNPYSSFVVKELKGIENYPHSSFPEYIGVRNQNYYHKKIILRNFKNIKEYKNFVLDRADYQRSLQVIKHLCLEND